MSDTEKAKILDKVIEYIRQVFQREIVDSHGWDTEISGDIKAILIIIYGINGPKSFENEYEEKLQKMIKGEK